MRANTRRKLMRERLFGRRSDEGFSLIESVVALTIAGGVLSAMSIALIQTARASVTARQSQQATDVINEHIEFVRSLDYSKATLITSDLASDTSPLLSHTGSGTATTYFLTTSAGQEQVVSANVGLITDACPTGSTTCIKHVDTITRQNTPYTVSTYVTKVTDGVSATSDYRRVTVYATWSANGSTHTRKSSTFMTDTRRGLPLPRFTITSSQSIKTNVGATLAIAFTITNIGAPDAFNLKASTPPSGTWSWYTDGNPGDGQYTSTDAALTDTDGDTQSLKDTDIMQVGASRTFYAVRTIGVGEPATQTITITATSAAQPTATSGTNGLSVSILVDPASCVACTFQNYFLHNNGTYPGDTLYQRVQGNQVLPMALDVTAPAAVRTLLFNYSTNCTGALDCLTLTGGRHIKTGGTVGSTDPASAPAWYYSVPAAATYKGTASMTIWVQNATGGTGAMSLTAYLGYDNSASGTFKRAGTGTVTVPAGGSGWQSVTFGIPLTTSTGLDSSGALAIANNKNLAVQIVNSGTGNVRIAYDTQTYPAFLTMPRTSQCPAGTTSC